jgi:hypothetical protein
MSYGGKRNGAGRKVGSISKMAKKARTEAAASGELPHEFLLRISRGEEVGGFRPEFKDRMAAAIAAAPYFAPKMAATEVAHSGSIDTSSKEQRDASVAVALRADC